MTHAQHFKLRLDSYTVDSHCAITTPVTVVPDRRMHHRSLSWHRMSLVVCNLQLYTCGFIHYDM